MIKMVSVKGSVCEVHYVPKEKIYPAFGYCYGNVAVVREDLSPRVKKFVEAHELYHCVDKSAWGGWVGREIRANFFPGIKDPVGLFATIFATVCSLDRLRFYVERFGKGR